MSQYKDYYKLLGVDKSASQKRLSLLFVSWLPSIILTEILMILKQKKNLKKLTKLTLYYKMTKNAASMINMGQPMDALLLAQVVLVATLIPKISLALATFFKHSFPEAALVHKVAVLVMPEVQTHSHNNAHPSVWKPT